MMTVELFERCKKNEARAQRELYDAYKARLMGLCRRYARNRDDAKDMLQEAFIKIFFKIKQVETVDKLESWMKSVAVNTAIDHYHKLKKNALTVLPPDQEVHAAEEGGYEVVIKNMTDEFLISLIGELPEGCRMVFNLFEIEGYNHSEISSMMSISEGTSRSQLFHAKQLLKQKLNRLGIRRYEKFA